MAMTEEKNLAVRHYGSSNSKWHLSREGVAITGDCKYSPSEADKMSDSSHMATPNALTLA